MLWTWTGRPAPLLPTERRRGWLEREIFSFLQSSVLSGRCLCVLCLCFRRRTEASAKTSSVREPGNRQILADTNTHWEWTASKWIGCHRALEWPSPPWWLVWLCCPQLEWADCWWCKPGLALRAGKAGRGRFPTRSHNWWRSGERWWRAGSSQVPVWTPGGCCLPSGIGRSLETKMQFGEKMWKNVFSLEKIWRVIAAACWSWRAEIR